MVLRDFFLDIISDVLVFLLSAILQVPFDLLTSALSGGTA